jgi:UDP-glucose 4-epimerase
VQLVNARDVKNAPGRPKTGTGRPVPVRWGTPTSESQELRADSSLIKADLGWQPSRSSLDTIVADAWQALTGSAH